MSIDIHQIDTNERLALFCHISQNYRDDERYRVSVFLHYNSFRKI